MHIIKHRSLIHSKVFIILLITLIWLVADALIEFIFPTYLERMNKSYFEIGVLISLASLGGLLIDLPMGLLSDRVSRKKLMILGTVLFFISGGLILIFKETLFLIISFFLWGLAYQVWKVPRDSHYAALTDKNKRAEFYGFNDEVEWLSQTIGPLIGGFIFLYLGFSGIMSTYFLFLLIVVLILLLFLREKYHHTFIRHVSGYKKLNLKSEIREFKIFGLFGFLLLYFSMLSSAWGGILWTLEPLFYGPDVLNIPPNLGGLLLAFFSLPGIFLSYFAGKLADKFGKKKLLFLGMSMMGIFLILFSMTHNLFLIFLTALLISISWVFYSPALSGLIIDLSYKHRKGEICGIWNFFMDVGFTIGPFLGGLFAEIYGIRNTFLAIGIIFAISSIFLLLIKSKN